MVFFFIYTMYLPFYICKGFAWSDIIYDNNSVCSTVVGCSNRSKAFLPGCIPYLKFYSKVKKVELIQNQVHFLVTPLTLSPKSCAIFLTFHHQHQLFWFWSQLRLWLCNFPKMYYQQILLTTMICQHPNPQLSEARNKIRMG